MTNFIQAFSLLLELKLVDGRTDRRTDLETVSSNLNKIRSSYVIFAKYAL